jgi:hypothetical protein
VAEIYSGDLEDPCTRCITSADIHLTYKQHPTLSANFKMTKMSNYIYKPLDRIKPEIRLLKIRAKLIQDESAPLQGTIEHHYFPLVDATRAKRLIQSFRLPIYSALSYVWGDDPALSHEIILEKGKVLRITKNLHVALSQLRQAELVDFRIWADAICINQNDLDERSSQIRLMRQIYHMAADVRIWLGPGTPESEKCIEFLEDLESTSFDDAIDSVEEWSTNLIKKMPFTEEQAAEWAQRPMKGVVKFGSILAQGLYIGLDVVSNVSRDELRHSSDEEARILALHRDSVDQISAWRPRPVALERVSQKYDLTAMALLVEKTLFTSPWFNRMWVVQEAAVSETLYVQMGMKYLRWIAVLRSSYYLSTICGMNMAIMPRIMAMEMIRYSWGEGKRPPLKDLIRECRFKQATEPKDKIYALLGLMGDKMNDLLRADYTKPAVEIYANAARHMVIQSSLLDLICGQQYEGKMRGLPSWVPDFSLTGDKAPIQLLLGDQNPFCACGKSMYVPYAGDKDRAMDSWASLHVQGVYIGEVSAVITFGNEVKPDIKASDKEHGNTEDFINETWKALVDIWEFVANYDSQWASKMNSEKSFAPDTASDANILQRIVSRDSIATVTDEIYIDRVSTILHTLLCGRINSSDRIGEKALIRVLTGDQPTHRSQEDILKDPPQINISDLFKWMHTQMIGRNFLVLDSGAICVGPEGAVEGDEVYVLIGCSVPVVLRKDLKSDNCESILMGECYVKGFMDGEALFANMNKKWDIEDITLR